MKYRKLGTTDIEVSLIGLGSMTWGQQNTEAEAHEQIDYALDQGVNLIDTAEMYPVPPRAETQGLTEQYIGTWLAKSGRRQDIFLASKVAGPARDPKRPRHIRDGNNHLDRRNLTAALDSSLKRLQTDYLDLYQLHWPDRTTVTFGTRAYPWVEENDVTPIDETLEVLGEFVKAGKVRHIGVSNETPWGVSKFLQHSDTKKLPRIATIQNPYSLLNRTFENGLSEFSRFEQVGLLAYSPLAFGMLSGKYINGVRPDAARITLFSRFARYSGEEALTATRDYALLAKRHGLTPVQMALAFVNQQRFVTSNLVGATGLEQLKENIATVDITLSPELLAEINEIHVRHPNPAP